MVPLKRGADCNCETNMKNLNSLKIFVRVAEMRSLARAAQRLNLTPSAVSKSITKLEFELGVSLFSRNTRTVQLTSDGARFLGSCKDILAQLDEAESNLNSTHTSVSGRIRIQSSAAFGSRFIVPAFPAFLLRYPNIAIDLELTDRTIDLVHDGVDVSIIIGPIFDDRVVARKICDVHLCACASPEYIKAHGEPLSPDDLSKHTCLGYVLSRTGQPREWKFLKDGNTFTKTVSGPVNINNPEALLQCALRGLGIAMLGTVFTAKFIRSGKLKILMREYLVPSLPIWALYLPDRNLELPRIKAFVDFLREVIPQDLK